MAAAVSLVMHAGIVLSALDWAGRIDPGAISEPSDAVSVELVATDTTDALKPERTSEPAPRPEANAPVAGSPTPAESSEKAKPLEKEEAVEKAEPTPMPDANDPQTRAADRGEAPDAPAVVPAAPAVDTPMETMPEAPKAKIEAEDTRSKPKEAKRVEKKVARPEGGITSKAKAGKGTGSERISASSGSTNTYKAAVQARINANRPSGGTPGGTALVAFGVTSTGALAYARITRSSGDAANDGLALAAVRGAAPFPPPPPGAPRQFTIPYDFR